MKRTWKWHFYFVRQHLLDISPNKNGQNQVASVLWETFNNWKDGRNTTVQEINEQGFFNWFQRKYIVRGSWLYFYPLMWKDIGEIDQILGESFNPFPLMSKVEKRILFPSIPEGDIFGNMADEFVGIDVNLWMDNWW